MPAVVTVLGFPVPPSLQVSVPVTPLAVITEFPQLFTTLSTGAVGTGKGAVVTELLDILVHPPEVWFTEIVVAVVNVLGLPVPPSLQVSVPVTLLAVTVELPQLFTTDNTGADGTGKGAVVTVLLVILGQVPTV